MLRPHEQLQHRAQIAHQMLPPGQHIQRHHHSDHDIEQRGRGADHALERGKNVFGVDDLLDHIQHRRIDPVDLIDQSQPFKQPAGLGELLQPFLSRDDIPRQRIDQIRQAADQTRDQQSDQQTQQPQQQQINDRDRHRARRAADRTCLAA